MYYNTTNETKETVKKFKKVNQGQDKKVLNIIKKITKPFSSSLVWEIYQYPKPPLTSIRRSINTLKNLELIEETGRRVMGLYGRSELQYKLS
jgi:predicted methyltransferase